MVENFNLIVAYGLAIGFALSSIVGLIGWTIGQVICLFKKPN